MCPVPPQDLAAYWDRVYRSKDIQQVSWYQPVPTLSLASITQLASPDAVVVDVGAGASHLVDHLLAAGFANLTVVDVSLAALELVRERLGAAAADVTFVASNVLDFVPDAPVDIWHDRAVFHFMTTPTDQQAYRARLKSAVKSGGHAIVAAFHTTGPARCSGLPTARYDAASLHDALGGDTVFELVDETLEIHPHPQGGTQTFQVVVLRRRPDAGG